MAVRTGTLDLLTGPGPPKGHVGLIKPIQMINTERLDFPLTKQNKDF